MPISFDDDDLNNAASETGVVHEDVFNTDHNSRNVLKQGYRIENPYLASDLVGYWPLQEEGTNIAFDRSGNTNDGNIVGATQGATGLLGTTAYSFDGVDDVVSLPDLHPSADIPRDDPAAFQNFTVCGWFLPNAINDGTRRQGVSIAEDNGIQILSEGDGQIRCQMYRGVDGWAEIDTTATNAEWYHIACRYDGTTFEAFKNAASVGSMTGDHSSRDAASQAIGSNDLGAQFWDGDIADVRVYNATLSNAQIQYLYDVVDTPGELITQTKTT